MLAMLMTLAGVVSANAADVTFTLNIDNPDALLVEVNYQEQSIVPGPNEFTVPEYTAITVKAIPPYAFRSITDASGTLQSFYDNTWYYYVNQYTAGTYDIVTYNMDETRTASCTVKVDNVDKVNAIFSGTNARVILQNGINTVKFDPNTETSLQLSAISYNVPLYSVTLDGEKVESQGGTFNVPLSQDCYIDVTADIPDIDVTVTFNYSENGLGALSGVSIDGAAVSDFNGTSLTMKAGKNLGLIPNSLFNIQSLEIDGTSTGWTGGYTYNTVVVADMTINITAQPYAMLHGSVVVDDASNIILYRGYAYQGDVINLTNGTNTIEVPENYTIINWKAARGCLINSVSVNGTALESGIDTYNVAEGDVIEFTTSKIVMDMHAVLWIDNPNAVDNYFSFQDKNYERIELVPGYNPIDFYSAMTPFLMSWYSQTPVVGKIYIDGEQISPMYEGSSSYELPLANGSVAKVFLANEPEECTVTLNSAEGVNATVIRDLIVPVTDLNGSFTAFKGTEMTVTPADGEKLTVTVNDTEVTPDEEGAYTLTVNDATTLIDIAKDSSGIDNVATDNNVRNADVYNLQGIKVGRASDASTLPAGIYIIDGKKVMIK